MSDEEYEYSDESAIGFGSDGGGEEGNQLEIDIENAYCEGDDCKTSNPKKAREIFEKVVQLETGNGSDTKWRFKSLEHLVAIYVRLKDQNAMLQRYTALLTIISESSMTHNECASAINNILALIADEAPEMESKVYELTLSILKAGTNNDRLRFSTLVHYGEALLRKQDYRELTHVVRNLHTSSQLRGCSDDPTKDAYLLKVYALEIQLCTATKDTAHAKDIYTKMLNLKATVVDPRTSGVIHVEGGKMLMGVGKWSKAYEEFYEGFRGYQEANDSRAKDALKYMVLANMLALSDINPFAAHETKAFQEETEIMAMQMLRSAYEANDIDCFERTLKNEAICILDDSFITRCLELLRLRMRDQVMRQPLQIVETTADILSLVNNEYGATETVNVTAALIALKCRSALVKSPAASRAFLTKHGASIDPKLAMALEVVGSYADASLQLGRLLLEAVHNNHTATVVSLLMAGSYTGTTSLLAKTVEPFEKLPEDCAGDVLEFLDIAMTRKEALHIATHCSSPEACAWVRAVVAAAAASAIANTWAKATVDLVQAVGRADGGFAVQDCLSRGADIEDKPYGETALLRASREGHYTSARLLMKAGAILEAKDHNGRTALIWASLNGHTALAQLLVEAGADKNVKDHFGLTALIWASKKNIHKNGITTTVQLLVDVGADLEAKDHEHGRTALIWASEMDHTALAQLLVGAGADKDAMDHEGETALDIARKYKRTAMMAILEA